MSKYYKVEDVEAVMADKHMNRPLDSDRWVIGDIGKSIADLPTIEVSEDCISRVTALDIAVAYVGAEMVDRMLTAPSVVPTQTNAIQHTQSVESVEPTTEQSSKVDIDALIEQVDNLIAFEKELIEEYGERIEE